MTHLDDGSIQAYLDAQLSAAERGAVAEHLVGCARCRAVHDELQRVRQVVSEAVGMLEAPAMAVPAARVPMTGRVRRTGSLSLARAAVLVLLMAAAASAAVPGSPIREWITRSAPEPAADPAAVDTRQAVEAVPVAPEPVLEGRVAERTAAPEAQPLDDFQPFHVAYTLPALLNADDVTAAISRAYPPDLVRQGIGGEAVLLLWLDEEGRVARSLVAASSGHRALDDIALDVSRDMRFRPARNRDQAVRVVVQMPVTFHPEAGGTGGG